MVTIGTSTALNAHRFLSLEDQGIIPREYLNSAVAIDNPYSNLGVPPIVNITMILMTEEF